MSEFPTESEHYIDVLEGRSRWCVVHGDALTVLRGMNGAPGFAIVSDPPYGTGWARGGGLRAGEFHAKHEKPAWDVFDVSWLELVRLAKFAAVFGPGSQRDALVAAVGGGAMWWKKTNPRPNGPDRDVIAVRPAEHDWREFVAYNGDTPLHPCEKSLDLMLPIVALTAAVDVVLDPFAGSGSTGVAAIRLGRRVVLIEQDAGYAALIRERMQAEELQTSLAAARAGQEPLFRV